MRLLYKPIGMLIGVTGGLLAAGLFKRSWKLATHQETSPEATDRQKGWVEVIAAAALEGAIFGTTKALLDRAGAAGFARLTGVWPGDEA